MKILMFIILLVSFITCKLTPDVFAQYVNVDVENDANVFWWMYGSKQESRDTDPIIMWLQGGPGGSSMLGDLCEIGPTDFDCPKEGRGEVKDRKYSWNSAANLIFVDQPVGTGFSYVGNPGGYAHDEKKIDEELLKTLQDIMKKFPHFEKNPFYIFSESYGGKMCANFARRLVQAIEAKEIVANFKGIGLGDSWISPVDCMLSYAPFLVAQSHIDDVEASTCNKYAHEAEDAMKKGDTKKALELWGQQQGYVWERTELSFYNILNHYEYDDSNLTQYVNTVMRKLFQVIPDYVQWTESNETVFENLGDDFMNHGIDAVDFAISKGLKVFVYTGMLDLIVDTLCTEYWIKKLKWADLEKYYQSKKELVHGTNHNMAFKKSYDNFYFWMIVNAGHMVPQDNPEMAFTMISEMIK